MKYILFLLIPIIAFAQVGNQKIRYQDLERTLERDVRRFSGDPTLTGLDSVGVYEHITSMKMYNVLDYGVTRDSTNAILNNILLNAVMDSAYSDGNAYVYIPPGKYLISPDARTYGGQYGIQFGPDIPIIGAGIDKTIFYMSDSTAEAFQPDETEFRNVSLSRRNVYMEGFTIVGLENLNMSRFTSGNYATGENNGSGINIFNTTNPKYGYNNVVIKNISLRNLGLEPLSIRYAKYLTIEGCDIRNTDFNAYTFSRCPRVNFINNIADSVRGFMEASATPYTTESYADLWGSDFDSTFTFINIRGNSFTNTLKIGLRIYSADYLNIESNIITGMDTITDARAEGDLLLIEPKTNYPSGYKLINISDNTLLNARFNAIILDALDATDTQLGDVTIRDNNIKNTLYSGIYIGAYDSSKCSSVSISNNRIDNFNSNKASDRRYAGIYVDGFHNIKIDNNRIKKDGDTGLGSDPVSINDCDSITISNNNFFNPAGAQRIFINDNNTNIISVFNNDGLDLDNSIYFNGRSGTDKGSYQQFSVISDGIFIGSIGDSIGYKLNISDPDLYVVKFDKGGSATTDTFFITTKKPIAYAACISKTDTIGISSSYTRITNSNKNLLTQYQEEDISFAADTVLISYDGLYEIEMAVTFRQATDDTNRIDLNYAKNGAQGVGGMQLYVGSDTLGYFIQSCGLADLVAGDVIDMRMRSALGNKNIIINSARMKVEFLKR